MSQRQSELKCSYCIDWYDEGARIPKEFPCRHNVCASCVMNLLGEPLPSHVNQEPSFPYGRMVRCPVCHADARTEGITTNRALASKISAMIGLESMLVSDEDIPQPSKPRPKARITQPQPQPTHQGHSDHHPPDHHDSEHHKHKEHKHKHKKHKDHKHKKEHHKHRSGSSSSSSSSSSSDDKHKEHKHKEHKHKEHKHKEHKHKKEHHKHRSGSSSSSSSSSDSD